MMTTLLGNSTLSYGNFDHTTFTTKTGTTKVLGTFSWDPNLHLYAVTAFFGLCVLVGLIGNSLVIIVMARMHSRNGQRLNNTNIFILNLAVADILFLTLCVPFQTTIYTLLWWPFGKFLCFFSKFSEEMTKAASIFSLVALSMDRFFAVAYATSATPIRNRTNALRGLIFIWVAAIGMAVPALFTREYGTFRGYWLCGPCSKELRQTYELVLFVIGYVLPLFIIIGSYMGMLYFLCKTSRNSSLPVSRTTSDSRKKVTRIVVVVVLVFALCWLPHYVFSLWALYDEENVFSLSWTLGFRIFSHCLAYANSCMNPIIYAFVSKKLRKDFKRACSCQHISGAFGSGDGQMRGNNNGTSHRSIYNRNPEICPRSPITSRGNCTRFKLRGETVAFEPMSSPDTRCTRITINNAELDPFVEDLFEDEMSRDTDI